MTDKVQRIHEEVERLKEETSIGLSEHENGIEQGRMEIINALSLFLDSLQEEPKKCMYTKDDFTEEDRKILCEDCEDECEYAKKEEPVSEDLEKAAVEAFKQIVDENRNSFLEIFKAGAEWQKTKDEFYSKDLGEYINKLSKQFPEVSFAKLSRIAVRVAKWKEEDLWKPADGDDLPEIDREVIALLDNGKVVFAHRPPEYWDGKDIITGKVTRNYVERYDKGLWNIPNVKWWLDCLLPNMEE